MVLFFLSTTPFCGGVVGDEYSFLIPSVEQNSLLLILFESGCTAP
jgi:hypothetical protein